MTSEDILDFWFEAGAQKWWVKDADLDRQISEKFLTIHKLAADGDLDAWCGAPGSALALVILLDQFSRNMFRGDPRTFAQDPQARSLAKEAIEAGFDRAVEDIQRPFFYLPFMHAENLELQDYCVALYRAAGDDAQLPHALEHRDIICRFRRFPHRNQVLGRETSPAEQAFLDNGGFGS